MVFSIGEIKNYDRPLLKQQTGYRASLLTQPRPQAAITTQFSPGRLIRADDAPTQLESSGHPSNSAYHFTSFHKEIASILMSVPNYDMLLFPSETERYGPIQYHVYLGRQMGDCWRMTKSAVDLHATFISLIPKRESRSLTSKLRLTRVEYAFLRMENGLLT